MRSLALLVFIVPGVIGAPSFVAVVPDLPGTGPGDEGFAIHSDGADLTGWSVSDGEGTWVLPHCVGVCWFTGHQDAWMAHDGPAATEWDEPQLALANDGDTLELLDPDGRIIDTVAWGPETALSYSSPGAVFRAVDGDWVTPRIHRIGETQLDQPTFQVPRVTLYASPDSSFGVLLDLITTSTERLHLHVHDLTHPDLIEAMADAAASGVDVQVLVDGTVVGRSHADEAADAAQWGRIQSAGGTVVVSESGRFAHHHLKVLVADDAVAVQSENWNPSGVPATATYGNRGWGVVAHDRAMTDWFAGWMADDRDAWDVHPLPASTSADAPVFAPLRGTHAPTPAVTLEGTFRITPLISPDHTAYAAHDAVLAAMDEASARIWGQQLRMDLHESNRLGWNQDDRYARALNNAANRDVEVTIHLAAPFAYSDVGNHQFAQEMGSAGASAKLWDHPSIGTLHNKGWIIDDAVVVGSMNGNHASRSANREVGLLVEGDGVASYFGQLWEQDDHAHSLLFVPSLAPVPTLLAIALVVRFHRARDAAL